MLHYWIELAIWLLAAYTVGCLVGWFLRNLGKGPAPAATMADAPIKGTDGGSHSGSRTSR